MSNRMKNIVNWAAAAILALVLVVVVCRVKSCADRAQAKIDRAVPGWIDLLTPGHWGQSERTTDSPQQPSIVPPGHSAFPRASRRPVFGNEQSEGTEVDIVDGVDGVDTLRLFVGENGTVRNRGNETLAVRVTKVGPAFIQWDPSAGVGVFVGQDHPTYPAPWHYRGYAVELAVKVKLVDLIAVPGLELGVPCVYLGSAGPGVGADLKLHAIERLAVDGVWWPLTKTFSVGVSINL